MAENTNTMAGLLTRNAPEYIGGLVNVAAGSFPELTTLQTRTIKGTTAKIRVRLNRPKGGFRALGASGNPGQTEIDIRNYDLKIYDGGVTLEQAYCRMHEGGTEMAIAEEMAGRLEGASEDVCATLWAGGNGNAFPALSTLIAEENKVNAGGTDSGSLTSVWLVSDDGLDGFSFLVGNEGKVEVNENGYFPVVDSNGNDAYRCPLLAFVGWSLANPRKAVRIANVDLTDSSKGITDDLIGTAKALLPTGAKAKIFMLPTALEQLRKSRTATNPTGAPAPLPIESMGMTIYVTDAMPATEATVSFA